MSLTEEFLLSHNNASNWNAQVRDPRFHNSTYRRLPPEEEALNLLQLYFDRFNSVFPLFDQVSFMSLMEQRYTRDPGTDLIWWAALNVVLSLAFRLRAISTEINETNDLNAWGFLQNALSIVLNLTMSDIDLLGVQALLGMAIILQGTFNSRPASILIATAIKLSHQLGLHKNIESSAHDAISLEQRNRTLWIVYILDKDYSIILDQPPLLRDDDLEIQVPSEIL